MLPRAFRPLDRIKSVETASAEPDDAFVGARIRDLRTARGMTIQDLADRTRLSVGFLSRVERDRANPSVKALHDISRALDVTISWFFESRDDAAGAEHGYIVRSDKRRRLVFESGISDQLLSPSLSGALELLLSRFPPGTSSGAEPYAHVGEEGGLILSGSLELWIGAESYLLEAGDSFTFPSPTPHRYRNPSATEETVVVWAITPPSY